MLVHSSPTGRVRKVRSSKTPQLLGEFKDSKNGGGGSLGNYSLGKQAVLENLINNMKPAQATGLWQLVTYIAIQCSPLQCSQSFWPPSVVTFQGVS